jgi:hypothetical protein
MQLRTSPRAPHADALHQARGAADPVRLDALPARYGVGGRGLRRKDARPQALDIEPRELTLERRILSMAKVRSQLGCRAALVALPPRVQGLKRRIRICYAVRCGGRNAGWHFLPLLLETAAPFGHPARSDSPTTSCDIHATSRGSSRPAPRPLPELRVFSAASHRSAVQIPPRLAGVRRRQSTRPLRLTAKRSRVSLIIAGGRADPGNPLQASFRTLAQRRRCRSAAVAWLVACHSWCMRPVRPLSHELGTGSVTSVARAAWSSCRLLLYLPRS